MDAITRDHKLSGFKRHLLRIAQSNGSEAQAHGCSPGPSAQGPWAEVAVLAGRALTKAPGKLPLLPVSTAAVSAEYSSSPLWD